jgi:hypothetical protein
VPIEINNENTYLNKVNQELVVKIGSAVIEVREGFNKKLFQDIVEVLIQSC